MKRTHAGRKHKKYSLKSAIFNVTGAWKALKTTTLANAWKKLTYDVDVDYDFEGLEATDFHRILQRAGERDVSEEDVRTWLEDTEGDSGYQIMTEELIADEVLVGDTSVTDDEEEDEPLPAKPKLSLVRDSLDTIISYIDLSSDSDVQLYYPHLRALQEVIIKKQHQRGRQTKLDAFFKPVRPSPATTSADNVDDPPAAASSRPSSPQLSTSGFKRPVLQHTTPPSSDSDSN